MTEALLIPGSKPTSVGTILTEEFMTPLKITPGALAKAMGVCRRTLNELCANRRGVTGELALLLGAVLGTSPEFWLNLQHMSDQWLIRNIEVFADKLEHVYSLVVS